MGKQGSVFCRDGFMQDRRGVWRIIVLATSSAEAARLLEVSVALFEATYRISHCPRERAAFQRHGDGPLVLASPQGRHEFEPVDTDDIEP